MSITQGQSAIASDFINESQKNATPANDAGRVPKLEADGKLSDFFTRQGLGSINAGETINGATLPVPVYQNKTDNEVYACDGNDTTKFKFIGFAISNSTDGNAIKIRFNGIVGGFSGLDEGEKYYLSDTAGAISNSPGTYEILVGIAISQTEILIHKGKRRATGSTTLGSSGSTGITLGFRPSLVRIFASVGSGGGEGQSCGGWSVIGSNRCSFTSKTGASTSTSGVRTDFAWYCYQDGSGASTGHRGNITSITDTGFTLDNTKEGSPTSVAIYWEAEGEY